MQEGTWKVVGRFMIIPQHTVTDGNGNYKYIPEEVIGVKRGENLHNCYFCGTPIQEHITFRDIKSGREVNIGNVCIDHLGDQLGRQEIAVAKGLDSLKSKVVREFKKRVHRKQLIDYLDANMERFQKPRNDKIDERLKENPKAYWNPAVKTISKDGKVVELKTTLWEQSHDANDKEYKDRNFLKVLRDDFEKSDWNAKPLIESFQKMINNEGFTDVIPKPRLLTEEEHAKMQKEVQVNIEEYLKAREKRK